MSGTIAIIMATFNGVEWIGEQLASIRAQTYENWHLFVRDDGSTDSTVQIIQQAMPREKLTLLDSRSHKTGSPAGNFFTALCEIDLTRYDFIAFSDQDDIWSPNKLKRAVEIMLETESDGYSCDLVAFDNTARRSWYIPKSASNVAFDYLFQGASAGCTYVISQRAAELVARKVRPYVQEFPLQRSHDWLTYAICRSHGLHWFQDKSAHIFYRQHSGNAFGALPSASGLMERWRLSRQGWYRGHVLWLSNFVRHTPEEEELLGLVARLGWRDRLRLIMRAREFRRSARDQWLLRFTFLTKTF